MKWLVRNAKVFDREKKRKMIELDKKIEQLKQIKNPRQPIKDQITMLEMQLEDLNPFLDEESEEKFTHRIERDMNGYVDKENRQ